MTSGFSVGPKRPAAGSCRCQDGRWRRHLGGPFTQEERVEGVWNGKKTERLISRRIQTYFRRLSWRQQELEVSGIQAKLIGNARIYRMRELACTQSTHKLAIKGLERVQRIGAQAVINAFKTVSLVIAEAEAGLETISSRLHHQYTATWMKLHSKSKNHRFWRIKKALGDLRNQVWISPLQKIARIC